MDHTNRSSRLTRAILPIFLELLAAVHGQAQAAEPSRPYPTVEVTSEGPQFRQMGGFEITGSSIIRNEQTQALPVQVITRQDIQRQGLTRLEQVFERLPNAINGAELGAVGRQFNGFVNGALHGMPTGTLVLLNGRRLAPFGIQRIKPWPTCSSMAKSWSSRPSLR